jgi:hypothetical protein
MRVAPITLALLSSLALVTAAPLVTTGPDFDPESKEGVEYYSGLVADHHQAAAGLSSAEEGSPEALERQEHLALAEKHYNTALATAKKHLPTPTRIISSGDVQERVNRGSVQLRHGKALRENAFKALSDPKNLEDPEKAAHVRAEAADHIAKGIHLKAQGGQDVVDSGKQLRDMERQQRVRGVLHGL